MTLGKYFVETRTINGETFLLAVCPRCKRLQIIPIDIHAKNCGVIRHCGTTYLHKILVNPVSVKVVCCKCKYYFRFKIRLT